MSREQTPESSGTKEALARWHRLVLGRDRKGGGSKAVAQPPTADADARSDDDSTGRYARLWNPSDETSALLQIYNTADPWSFEQGGFWDYERLAPFFDESSTLLDLGCGIGRVAWFVAQHCKLLWAVDASQTMLDMAASRLSHLTNITYARSQDTSFSDVPSDSVDLAYCLLVLQHLEREDAFLLLEELRRVCRPTGVVVLTFPNLLSETYLNAFVQGAHANAVSEPARARAYTQQEVEAVMSAAGFRVEIEAGTELFVVARPK